MVRLIFAVLVCGLGLGAGVVSADAQTFSFKIASDSSKFCTYGDGTGTPVSVPLGTPLIPSGPTAAPGTATPTGPKIASGPTASPDSPVCEHCGMDKPAGQTAGAPCTTCGESGPRVSAPVPKDARCVVCGENWPAGHPATANCENCGMDGGPRVADDKHCDTCGADKPAGHTGPCETCGIGASTMATSQICEHCGMDKPAGQTAEAPCTTCGESGPRVAAPVPKDAQCVVCGENWPAGHPATANCENCGMDGGPRVADDKHCDTCGADKPAGHSADAPCPTCGMGDTPQIASGPNTSPPSSAATPPSSTQPPAAITQTPDAPGTPQETPIVVTVVFKANMAKVQEGQSTLASLPEAQLAKLLSDAPATPGPKGAIATPAAQNANASDGPAACKSGPGNSCQANDQLPEHHIA